MKQRITVEQLSELTNDQKDKLREWWEPTVGDWYACWNLHANKHHAALYFEVEEDKYYTNEPDIVYDLPLLNIGQMIEYLKEHLVFNGSDYKILMWCNSSMRTTFKNWNVEGFEGENQHFLNNSVELVDALWESVKKVL